MLLQLAAGKGGQFAGIGEAQELNAGERVVVGQLHGVFAAFGGQGGFQVACNALAQLAVELRFGQIAQHGNVAFEYVAAGKQAHARALGEREQAGGGFGQLFAAGFKQFVARVGLQQVAQVVFLVAAVGKTEVFQHMLGFAAQHGDVPDTVGVGGGGVEADEAPLADNLAVGVEFLDADLVEIGRAVDAAALRRAVEQQAVVAQPLFFVGIGEGGKIVGNLIAVTGEDALRGVGFGLQARAAGVVDQIVFAEAHQQEMAVGQPAEEGDDFRILAAAFVQNHLVNQQKLAAQFVFAFHNRAQFGQEAADLLGQFLVLRGLAAFQIHGHQCFLRAAFFGGFFDGGSFAVCIAFDLPCAVQHGQGYTLLAVEQHQQGVEQEGEVVGHNFHQRVPHGAAGGRNAHHGLASGTGLLGEFAVGIGGR